MITNIGVFEILRTRDRIRKIMKNCRKNSAEQKRLPVASDAPLFRELRIAHFDQKPRARLTVFLRGKGCSWAEKTGGCTFCGFWSATNMGGVMASEDFLEQIRNGLSNLSVREAEAWELAIYNDGSLLDESELPFHTLIEMIQIAKSLHGFRRLVLECKASDVSDSKVSRLVKHLGERELLLAMGYESSNPLVRDLCINKGFTEGAFNRAIEILRSHNAIATALVIVKPPFLTDDEALVEVVSSIQQLDKLGLHRIDLEITTIQEFTLVELLWKKGLFQAPSRVFLERMLSAIVQLAHRTTVFVSPTKYSPELLDKPTDEVHDLIDCLNLGKGLPEPFYIRPPDYLANGSLNDVELIRRINEYLNIVEGVKSTSSLFRINGHFVADQVSLDVKVSNS